MYRLHRHRAFWHVYFGEKCLTEAMYKQQASDWLYIEIQLCYHSDFQEFI